MVIVIFSIEEEKGVVVTGHSWSRSIEVEQYKQVTEKDWRDRVPATGKFNLVAIKKETPRKSQMERNAPLLRRTTVMVRTMKVRMSNEIQNGSDL